jgi:hypothetical protein
MPSNHETLHVGTTVERVVVNLIQIFLAARELGSVIEYPLLNFQFTWLHVSSEA